MMTGTTGPTGTVGRGKNSEFARVKSSWCVEINEDFCYNMSRLEGKFDLKGILLGETVFFSTIKSHFIQR